MAKLSKEEIARYNGADWMLRLVKTKGIEEAEKELAMRGKFDIPMGISKNDLAQFINLTKTNCVKTITMLSSLTLRDTYGFGRKRLNRFIERFNSKTDCLLGDFCSWEDIAETLTEETGIEFEVPKDCSYENLKGVKE